MKRARRSATLAVLALAVAGHAVLLAMLALESPDLRFRITPSDRQAVWVTLAPPLPQPVKPSPPNRRPPPQPSAPSLPSVLPPAPPAAPARATIELPNLARPVFRAWPRPLPGGVNWGAAEDGCDDPGHHLTPEQRERCLHRWGEPSQQIAEIAPLISPEGKAEFDRRIRCRDKIDKAPVPVGAEAEPETLAHFLPSLRECPLADR